MSFFDFPEIDKGPVAQENQLSDPLLEEERKNADKRIKERFAAFSRFFPKVRIVQLRFNLCALVKGAAEKSQCAIPAAPRL